MEDYIYIILLVAWLAYSYYNAKQKQKQKEEAKRKAAEPQPRYKTIEPEKPRRSTLEEIFGKFEVEETADEEESPAYEEIREVYRQQSYYEPDTINEAKLMTEIEESRYSPVIDTSEPLEEKQEGKVIHSNAFDLRKAVIYSAILERPYQ